MHALGIAQHQPGVGGGAHVGAELAGQGAGAGAHALVLDVSRTVDGDVLAIACPGQASDAHRAFDFWQWAIGADDVGRLAHCRNVDAVMARVLVAGFDGPAQRAGLAIVGVMLDTQGFRVGRCGGQGGQGEQWQQGHQRRHQTHGCGYPENIVFMKCQPALGGRLRGILGQG